MEQKIIYKNESQCIFLMKETNLDFYLIIPNNKELSILLGLYPDMTDEGIKLLSNENDKAIVVPIVNGQILTNANHLDPTSFKYLDSILSYLINATYKILTHNKINVKQKILLNNNPIYENFNSKYLEKYQGRVDLYIPTPPQNNTQQTTQQGIDFNQNLFTAQSAPTEKQTFTPTEEPFRPKNSSIDELDDSVEPFLYDEPVVSSSEVKEGHEPGFVSYVLLGVLVAVITLVFLYMLL